MTKIETHHLVCSKCNTAFDVDLYETVNVTLDPEQVELFYTGKFNEAFCPNCKTRFYVDVPFLFHDHKDKDGLVVVNSGQIKDSYLYLYYEGYLDKYMVKSKFVRVYNKLKRATRNLFLGKPKYPFERIDLNKIDWKKLLQSMVDEKKEKV